MKNNFSISLQIVWLILLGCCITPTVFSQNLISNGSFGSFNAAVLQPAKTGYQSNYNQVNYNAGSSVPREFAITNDASSVNSANFISLKDHTTGNGTGNMMVVDGQNDEIFWKQDPDRQLAAGQPYVFSFWIANVAKAGNPKATIRVNPSGCSTCTPTLIDLNTLPAGWNKVSVTITTSSLQWVRIELSTVSAGGLGNDFAIDDLSLYGPPLPLEISTSQTNPSCTTTNDGVIVAYGAGGIQPYTYTLSGASSATNTTGIFQGLLAGTYSVQITDSDSSPKTVTSGPIELTIPTPITIAATPTGCILPGTPVTLTATGGSTTYTWTASSGTNPTSTANAITVTPTTTTTYTASSTINSTLAPSNLITNGDFENLNKGFSSDYGYYPTGNPTGAQIAYGIKTDPSLWYSKFGKYPDHTTGTGNMLICDGATDGTSVVWSQTVSVNPSTVYDFSFWIQNLTSVGTKATFKAQINGVDVTLTPISAVNTGAATDGSTVGGGWTELKATWSSASTSIATIKIIDTNNSSAGNDFALDDIVFKAQTPINKSCTLSTPYTVTIGGTPSTTGFSYTTPVCKNGTNPNPILVSGFTTGGSFSSTTGLTINPTTGEIDLATSTPGSYTVTYTVAANASLCIAAGSSTAPIVINAVPSISTTTPNSICGSGTVTLQATASSGTINWYATATGGSAIATGGSFTTPSINTTTTYYVDATANGCTTSTRTPIIATVHPLPTAPTYTATLPTCSQPTSTITITGPLPLSDYEFSLDGGAYSSTSTILGVNPGGHTLTARNKVTSCISTITSISISPIPTPATSIVSTNTPATCGNTDGTLTLGSVTGGTAPYTYSLDGGSYSTLTTYSNLSGGNHTLLIKDSNDCISNAININIPLINAPTAPIAVASAQPTCTNANAGAITVTPIAGLTYSIDGITYTNTTGLFTNLSAGSYFVTAKNTTGCISPSTTIIINPQPISPVLTINNPIAVCSPSTVDLTAATVTLGSTGNGVLTYWNDAAATVPLINPNAIATSGTYYIKSTVAGLCFDIKPVTVTVRPTETLTINCTNATYNSVTFGWNSISDVANFTYSTTINGNTGPTGSLAKTATTLTIPNLNQGDSVVLTITPNGSNCVVAATSAPCAALTCVVPVITPLSDLSVCSGDTIPTQMFNSTPSNPATLYNWTISTYIGSVLNGSGNIPAFTSVNTSNTAITAIVSVQATLSGCTGPTMTFKIKVNPQPTLTIIPPAPACLPNTVDITKSYTATGGGVISYWQDAAATQPLASPNALSVSGTYYIKSSFSGACTVIQPISVTVHPAIIPQLSKGMICIDASSKSVIKDYTLDTQLSHPNFTYKWYLDGVFLPSENRSTLVAQKGGTYSVIVTNSATGCQSEEITAEVIQSEPAIASYTLTKSFSDEQMFTVKVKNGKESDYTYQLDDEPIQTSPIFYSVSPGRHKITIRDIEGCQDTVLNAYALDYPNFFTPNGDGSNDTWNITELSNQPNAIIHIFDRFGKLLEEIRPNGPGWDGTYNSKDLPATDYWFKVIFDENGQTVEFKSHFSLLR